MTVKIAVKELYTNLISARFTIGFLLCLFLIPFTMLVSINDYGSLMRAYEMEMKEAGESMNVRVYSALRPVVVKPPEPLSIFSRGISYQVGNEVRIQFGELPMLAEGRSGVRENPLMNSFFSLDFASVTAIIMSLLALLFTYDACTGERERGTLKLLVASSVNRSTILIGKFLGVILTLLPVILFCYIMCAIIILVHPAVGFSAGEWSRIAILFSMSVTFFSLFAALGLLISTRSRSSVTSIVVCLFVWVTAIFIIPNLSVYAARSFYKTNSPENLRFALDELDSEFREKRNEITETVKKQVSPDWWMHWNMNGGYDGYLELAGSSKSLMEYHRRTNEETEPLRIDYADKKWALQDAYLHQLDRQRRLSELLALLSPSEIFRQTVSTLCRTDVGTQYEFLAKVREYREELIQHFIDKKIFSSWTYFTRQDPDSFMSADEIVRTRTGGQFATVQEYNEWARSNNGSFTPLWKVDIPGTGNSEFEPLDISSVPRFHWRSVSLLGNIRQSLGRFAALVFMGIILFYLSYISFIRYDVR